MVLPIMALNHAVNDGSVYLISSLFPIVLAIFGLSVVQVGILVGAGYLVTVIGQPLVGRFSEGSNPKVLLAIGIGIISASALSFTLANGFYSILGSVLLLRAGSSFFHPVGVSAVSKTYLGSGLDRAMGIQSAFGNLGIFLVFLTSAPVYLVLGWRGTFLVFAAIGAIDIAATLRFLRVPRDPHPIHSERPLPKKGTTLLGVPAFFLISSLISGGCFAVVLNYTNILLETQTRLSVFWANLAVAGWVGFAFLGAVSTGRWTRVLGRASLLVLLFLLSAATIAILAFFPDNLTLAVPALLANGFTLSATYPLTYSELSDFLSGSSGIEGRSFGAVFAAQTIGGSAFGLASGYLSTVFGLSSAYLMAGLFMGVGAAAAALWSEKLKNR
jgi:MFS family permease